jgi:hypothetical protein
VLRRPPVLGPATVVVRPDDLVQERRAPEDTVKEHLAVVNLAVVDVEVKASVRCQNAVRLGEPRFQEGQMVVEEIAEALGPDHDALVATALEPDAGALCGAYRLELRALLDLARVEWRIDAHEVHAGARKRPQDVEVLGEVDRAGHSVLRWLRDRRVSWRPSRRSLTRATRPQ